MYILPYCYLSIVNKLVSRLSILSASAGSRLTHPSRYISPECRIPAGVYARHSIWTRINNKTAMWANNRFCLGQYGDLSPPERNCNGLCGDRSDPGAYAWLVCYITSLSMEYLVIDFDTVFQNDDRALETFSALLALCAGNSPITSEFPHKGQWRGALMFSLICPWINGWINNREAGDLRHHRAHNGITVMNVLFACHNCAPLWGCGHRHSRAICTHCELYLGDLIV